MTRVKKPPFAARVRQAKQTADEAEMMQLICENSESALVLAAVASNKHATRKVIDTLAALHLDWVGTDLIVSGHLHEADIERLIEVITDRCAAWRDGRLIHLRPDAFKVRLAAAAGNPNLSDAVWRQWAADAIRQLSDHGEAMYEVLVAMDRPDVLTERRAAIISALIDIRPDMRSEVREWADDELSTKRIRAACRAALNA